MLLHDKSAEAIAKQQALVGLELAHAANEAHTGYVSARNDSRIEVKRSLDLETAAFVRVHNEVTRKVTVSAFHYKNLADAAGALIGRNTLGGEYISIQNSNEPRLYSDGSYLTGQN
jgi:hypothetical protein